MVSRHLNRVSCELPTALAEQAGGALAAWLPEGVLVSPLGTPARAYKPGAEAGSWSRLEGWFADAAAAAPLRRQLSALGARAVRLRSERARDWLRESKASFPAQRLGRFWVAPAWRRERVPVGLLPIRLLQGQAFGTGLHASTRLMLRALERGPGLAGCRVLDVGAGSGILCFAALHLGARACHAVELEAAACDELKANREANQVAPERLKVVGGAFPRVKGLRPGYPRVLANLTAPVLLALMPALARAVEPAGRLDCSGIFRETEARAVARALRAAGLRLAGRETLRGWWRLEARKP